VGSSIAFWATQRTNRTNASNKTQLFTAVLVGCFRLVLYRVHGQNTDRRARLARFCSTILLLLTVSAAHAQSKPTKIPLIQKNGLYYAQVKINGNEALLLIDTGATITLLNRKFSSLAVAGSESLVWGVGTPAKGNRVHVRLDIGLRRFMADAVIGDFQIPDADGSLGSDVLSACGMVVFDYANETMLLYRSGTNAAH
jgi:hypothetical protein